MDQAFPMGIVERQRDLPRELDRVVHRQLPLATNPLAQALTPHVGHGVPELTGGLAGVEDGQDMRVLQPRRGADFSQEALGAECRRQVAVEELDGDRAIVLEVTREVNRGHPPSPELMLEGVALS